MTKSNDHMNQTFIEELRCHFNLRRPKSEKPTNIYMVVYLRRKQYYFATGVKVYPKQWSKKKQVAIISNTLTEIDNDNNKKVNKKIEELKLNFQQYKSYISANVDAVDRAEMLLKCYIYKDMKSIIKGTELLQKAFDFYYKYRSKSRSSRTKEGKQAQLNKFFDYIRLCGLPDDLGILSQHVLNTYRDYLHDESKKEKSEFFHGGIETLNQLCQCVALLINEVIASENDFLEYNIKQVNYHGIINARMQENKPRRPLDEDEIKAIKDCKLKENREYYRDIFLFQIECGQRVSDIIRLLKGDFRINDDYVVLGTKKEATTSYFEYSDYIKSFFAKYENGYGPVNVDKLDSSQTYNYNIKRIAEIAGLNRVIDYTDTNNNKKSDIVSNLISSHWARHTFVVRMKRKGYSADEICKMTGHKDDKMVKFVYGHYGDEDAIKTLKTAKARVEGEVVVDSPQQKKKGSVIDSVFGYGKMIQLSDLNKSGIDLSGLPLTNECVQIMLSTSSLSKAIEYCKGKEISQLKNKALELYDIVKTLTIMLYNPNIYHIYEYKLYKFGFIKEMMPIDMIEDFFREPTEEELIQQQLEDLQ